MTSFASSSLRLLRRLLHVEPARGALHAGPTTVLDGLSAVAVTEACIAECAALGATYPAAVAARVFDREQSQRDVNAFDEPIIAADTDGARGALAAALGMAMAGQRATTFLSGPDVASAPDLLAQAAGRHLPLVLHLACRSTARHAQSIGSGHEAYHAAADAGCIQFFATNVQEAVDLAVIARHAAERALVPAIIAMDGEQTALAAQDVALPDREMLRAVLREPMTRIRPPTDAQRMLFGDPRRLVPRWFDLERPMMLSPLEGTESWALGVAGARPFFTDQVREILTASFEAFRELTDRSYGPLIEHHLDKADLVLVAQGAAVETAIAIADWMREHERRRVGVLGIRCLRPLPAARIAHLLGAAKTIAVLERIDTPLSGDGPLIRELRAAFDRAGENARFGPTTHPEFPALDPKRRARFVSVPYGLGGLPLRAADLSALITELADPRRSLIYLGLDFLGDAREHPKRQALMDTLRRTYGDLNTLSLRSDDVPPALCPDSATTIAIHRLAGREMESLAGDAAALVHEALGGHLRSRPGITWQRFDRPCMDIITHSPSPLRDPGDDVPIDIALLAAPLAHRLMKLGERVSRGGCLLLIAEQTGDELLGSLPSELICEMKSRDIALKVIHMPVGSLAGLEAAKRTEILLGGLLAILFDRQGGSSGRTAAARDAREAMLADLSEAERDRRMEVFITGLAAVTPVDLTAFEVESGAAPSREAIETPPALRTLSRTEHTVDALPRFWDQTGVLYRTGETDELTAEPYLAAGAIPPLSSMFRDVSGARRVLPAFDPETCDGNGSLWTSDPDGAIAALVISSKTLLDAGIEMAAVKGKPSSTLRSISGKLAKRLNKMVAAHGKVPTTARGLLGGAYDDLMESSKESGERKKSLDEAMAAVLDEIGELPLARTPVFFDEREKASAGSGEFLALFVNPDACKCPEATLHVCQGRGLKAIEQTPDTIAAARRLWNLWQRLPDTSGDTIEYARTHPNVGPLAAIGLSRHCHMAMAGGDGAEPGSGARLALRNILSTCEYHLQPRLQQQLERIDALREKLSSAIREMLADALPANDLDALADGLDALGRQDLDLSEISGRIDEATTQRQVDGARLGRLVDAARGLADLRWRLAEGVDGLGRSRVGLTIAPGSVAMWAGAFPHNPFACPVALDAGGETGHLARGLIEGQIHLTLAGIRLMRWAQLEIDEPKAGFDRVRALNRLRLRDLTDAERLLVPPMLVVGDGRTLGGRGLSQLAWLLNADLPVKVVVLSDIGGAADGGLRVDAMGGYPAAERFDLALLALLNRNAFVTQTSIAHGEHFATSVLGALEFDGPALVHIHAPSPERHGFAPERLLDQAALALRSRAFPLFTFDPSHEGVFGSCLDLSANPDSESTWCVDDTGRPITPADWMASEARFAEHLSMLTDDHPAPIPISEYLAASSEERDGRTPFVAITDDDHEEHRLRIDAIAADDIDRRARLWRTLQELAGVVTPFTERVREQAEREVKLTHEEELEQVRKTYESKLAELRAGFETEATQRVTEGLMALIGYGDDDESAAEPDGESHA